MVVPAEEPEDSSVNIAELAIVLVGLFIAISGVVGLLLAVMDQYRTSVTLAVAIAISTMAAIAILRSQRIRPLGRSATAGWLLAVAIAAAFVGVVGSAQSQHVLTDRDPAVYQVAARWLADNPGLEIDPEADAFEQVPYGDLVYDGGAIYEISNGHLQLQFNHLSVVVLAIAFDVGGATAMYLVPALLAALGLLGIYGVTVIATRRPYLSALAPAVLALSMPLLFVARDTYSEPFVFGLLWAGIIAAIWNYRRPSVVVGGAVGLLAGALVGLRVDSLAIVGVLLLLGAASVTTAGVALRPALLRSYCVALVAMSISGAVGLADLRLRTGRYEADLRPQLKMLDMVVIACAALAALMLVVWLVVPALRRIVTPLPKRIATVAGAICSALFFGLWFIRPLVSRVRGPSPNSTVLAIQERDGMLLDATRTYAEHSVWWMSWYLGPITVAMAFIGLGICVRRILRGTANAADALVVGLCVALGGLYWWQPSNTPDQVWVMRRYVPVALPSVAILAVLFLAAAMGTNRWRGLEQRVKVIAIGLVAAAMLVPPAATTWPVRKMTFQPGYVDALNELCEEIGDDAAVLITESYERLVLSQGIRSWCQVPVASQGRPFVAIDYLNTAKLVADQGRDLWIVSLDGERLDKTDAAAGPLFSTSSKVSAHSPEQLLDSPPSQYRSPESVLPVTTPTPFAIHARRLEQRAEEPSGA